MKTLVSFKDNMDIVISRLVPNFVKVLYLMLRYRCVIEWGAKILLARKIRVGRGTIIRSGIFVGKSDQRRVGLEMGRGCFIQEFVSMHPRGDWIKLGDGVGVNSFSYIDGHGGVTIGDNTLLGPGVKIVGDIDLDDYSTDIPIAWSKKKKGVSIGRNVWVGANASIIDGARIGDGSIIGANAVVVGEIPPNAIAVGVPAKVVRYRKPQESQ